MVWRPSVTPWVSVGEEIVWLRQWSLVSLVDSSEPVGANCPALATQAPANLFCQIKISLHFKKLCLSSTPVLHCVCCIGVQQLPAAQILGQVPPAH